MVHIIPMTRCFFQACVQKNTHRHKGCDRLTSRKYFGSTSTKNLRLFSIGFGTHTNDDSSKDNNIFAIASLASDALDTGEGRGGGLGDRHHCPPQLLAMELLPPLPPAMAPRTSSASLASLPLPPPPLTMPPKSVSQIS